MLREREHLKPFLSDIQSKPRLEGREHIASISHESRAISDPYVLILTPGGELYSPTFRSLAKDACETVTELGKADYAALVKIEEIVQRETSGVVFWLSPPYGERESSKLIATEIVTLNGRKITFNRAVVLPEVDEPKLCQIGNLLAQHAGEEARNSGMDLRRKPIYLREEPIHWTHLLSELTESDNWAKIRTGEDWKIKRVTLKTIDDNYDEIISPSSGPLADRSRKATSSLFGDNPLTCPPKQRAFDLLFKLGEGKPFTGKCPLCSSFVENVSPGETCPGKREDGQPCGEVYQGCGSEAPFMQIPGTTLIIGLN